MPDSLKTSRRAKAAPAITTTGTQTVTVMDDEQSQVVTNHDSAAVQQSGFAETMQHMLAALQANLKLYDKTSPATVAAPGSDGKAPLAATSRFKWKKIHEV